VRPPLRADEDRVAMIRGVAAGDIDIIVSSHDPQDADDKRRPFAEATDGAVGLETLLPAALRLYHSGELPLLTILRALTSNPAKLLGLHSGRLVKGAVADIILFDPGEPWVVNKDLLRSRSKNTPFDEGKLQGRVLRTLVAGETVYQYPGSERT
jgi:dihydroorotase